MPACLSLLSTPNISPTTLALLQVIEPAIPALRSVLRPAREGETLLGAPGAPVRQAHRLAWQRVPLEDADIPVGTVIVFREDVTEGRLGLGRQSFLSTISHDLRTPLSAIVGFAELLRNNVGGLTEDEQREFWGTLSRTLMISHATLRLR